ncbi:MAG: hypothetical protein IJ411_04030 [Oscillospiraceae bacterium]|nr:hypothetical protein [Oscillospiraceae bacterium]
MNSDGKTATCVECGMGHSVERIREQLANEHPSKNEKTTESAADIETAICKPDREVETATEPEIYDSEWEEEPEEPTIYEATWDVAYEEDEFYARYLRFNAKLFPTATQKSWEKIEWDIWSKGLVDCYIDFSDEALSKLFPKDFAVYQEELAKPKKPTERWEIGMMNDKMFFEFSLTEEEFAELNSLLEAFVGREADHTTDPRKNVWEMELAYPNQDTKHKIRGTISDEVLENVKQQLLDWFCTQIGTRYPWIFDMVLD